MSTVFPGFIQEPAAGGGSLVFEDEGTPVPGGPHTTLNVTGCDLTITDTGGGTATLALKTSRAAAYAGYV